MRSPGFTAEAALSPRTAPFQSTDPGPAREGGVEPAFILGNCLRQCIASGADGCGEFCSCIARGGRRCPVLY
jgi:hypothetical protein